MDIVRHLEDISVYINISELDNISFNIEVKNKEKFLNSLKNIEKSNLDKKIHFLGNEEIAAFDGELEKINLDNNGMIYVTLKDNSGNKYDIKEIWKCQLKIDHEDI